MQSTWAWIQTGWRACGCLPRAHLPWPTPWNTAPVLPLDPLWLHLSPALCSLCGVAQASTPGPVLTDSNSNSDSMAGCGLEERGCKRCWGGCRVGTARFIASLTLHRQREMRPHTAPLIKVGSMRFSRFGRVRPCLAICNMQRCALPCCFEHAISEMLCQQEGSPSPSTHHCIKLLEILAGASGGCISRKECRGSKGVCSKRGRFGGICTRRGGGYTSRQCCADVPAAHRCFFPPAGWPFGQRARSPCARSLAIPLR